MPHLVRPLNAKDLPGLLAVQRACYGDAYIESAAVVARRMASPAQCSLVLERAGQLCAYLAAYDSVAGNVTPLHGEFEASDAPDTLYLHDLAVLPALAGQGLAQSLLAQLWRSGWARGLTRSTLVAVQGSQAYWERHGYAVRALTDAVQKRHLAASGEAAVYMQRALA